MVLFTQQINYMGSETKGWKWSRPTVILTNTLAVNLETEWFTEEQGCTLVDPGVQCSEIILGTKVLTPQLQSADCFVGFLTTSLSRTYLYIQSKGVA